MLKNKKTFLGIISLSFFTPLSFVSAAPAPQNLGELLSIFGELLTLLIPLFITIAVVAFLYGVAMYIYNSGNPASREESKRYMFWGIVGLFVMVSVWGLVAVIDNTFLGGGNNSESDTSNTDSTNYWNDPVGWDSDSTNYWNDPVGGNSDSNNIQGNNSLGVDQDQNNTTPSPSNIESGTNDQQTPFIGGGGAFGGGGTDGSY